MLRLLPLLAFGLLLAGEGAIQAEESPAPLYEENFDSLESGSTPEDYLVLLGEFKAAEGEGGKHLELGGTPLEDYGFLFGPSKPDGLQVSARVRGESKGRIHPGFGIGLNGVSGYKLMVSPSRRVVELSRGTVITASAEYKWKSGTWTRLCLRTRKVGESEWIIQGKAWPADAEEPSEWTITHKDE